MFHLYLFFSHNFPITIPISLFPNRSPYHITSALKPATHLCLGLVNKLYWKNKSKLKNHHQVHSILVQSGHSETKFWHTQTLFSLNIPVNHGIVKWLLKSAAVLAAWLWVFGWPRWKKSCGELQRRGGKWLVKVRAVLYEWIWCRCPWNNCGQQVVLRNPIYHLS